MHRYLNLHNIKPSFSVFQKIFEIIDFTGYCTILINRVSFSSLHITHVLVKIQDKRGRYPCHANLLWT